jgi:hypothetical protein
MVLIVTADPALAKRLLKAISEPKAIFLQPEQPRSEVEPGEDAPHVTDRDQRAEAAQRWLRNNVYERDPSVVALDVSFGGSLYRAAESVPKLVERGFRVILLVPFDRSKIDDYAIDAGCFDVISLRSRKFASELADAVSSALKAPRLPRSTAAGRVPGKDRMH